MDPLSLPSQGEAETLSLPDFRGNIYHKLLTGDLWNQFVKLLVWEGVNADLCMACTGLRESSLSRVMVSQDVGTQHPSQSLALALQAQTSAMAEVNTQALAA